MPTCYWLKQDVCVVILAPKKMDSGCNLCLSLLTHYWFLTSSNVVDTTSTMIGEFSWKVESICLEWSWSDFEDLPDGFNVNICSIFVRLRFVCFVFQHHIGYSTYFPFQPFLSNLGFHFQTRFEMDWKWTFSEMALRRGENMRVINVRDCIWEAFAIRNVPNRSDKCTIGGYISYPSNQ